MKRYVARSVVLRYAVAIVCVTATVGFALWLRPVALAAAQLFLVAILVTGWICGPRPALIAWGLATLAFAYLFTPPFDSMRIELVQLPPLIVFALLELLMDQRRDPRRCAPRTGRAAPHDKNEAGYRELFKTLRGDGR
jgi:K+-sensing histidine kinase KdpD